MKKLSIIFLIIILISLFFTNTLYATSSQELKKQNTDITNKIEEKHTEISGIETKMTEALNKIVSLNEKISNYEKEIANLNTQISSLNAQISEKETLIQEQEKKYSIQKELLEKRLITIYESGSTNYLDFLLSSSSLTDFISNYYLISTIAEAGG